MGRATIVSEAGEGLYTAQVVFDGSNVAAVQAAIDRQIADLEDQLEVAEDEIAEVEKEVEKYEADMAAKGETWNNTVAEELEDDPENVTHPDAEDPEHETSHVSFDALQLGEIHDLTGRFVDPVYEAPPAWAAETAHTRGDRIRPATDTGWQYRCRTDGTTGAEEPDWSTEENGTTLDGTAIWATVAVAEEVAPGAVAVYRAAGTVSYKGIVGGDEEEKPEGYEGLAEAPMERTVNRGRLDKAYLDYVAAAIQCHAQQNRLVSVEKFRDMLLFRIESLEQKKAELATAVGTGDPREMWCADYTEELTGEVDTVEIDGSPVPAIQIAPGGASELTAGSKLANIMAMSPSGAALAWMLLPGWQRWRPTYRVGKIHDIDYEAGTCSVTLDATVSIAQGLAINQAAELTGIGARYMECDMWVFEEGDRVVVEFRNQLNAPTDDAPMAGPVVVGFEIAPRPCAGYAAVFGGTEHLAAFGDENIHAWSQGAPATGGSYYTPLPASSGKFNNAWRLGAKLMVGASWSYPFQFDSGVVYAMKLVVDIQVVNTAGAVVGQVSMCFDDDAGGRSRRVGNAGAGTGLYTCTMIQSGPTNDGPAYLDVDYGDPCYDTYMAEYYPGEWIYARLSAASWTYMIQGLNGFISDYFLHVGRTDYSWVDPLYEACSGISAGTYSYGCDAENIQEGFPPEAQVAWMAMENPCDQPYAGDELYLSQAWSLSGTIDETGVTLSPDLSPVSVHGTPAPFGPWGLSNAGAGDTRVALPPVDGDHHVRFRISGILTAEGELVAIAQGETEWIYPGISYEGLDFHASAAGGGGVEFYAAIKPPWED